MNAQDVETTIAGLGSYPLSRRLLVHDSGIPVVALSN